MTHFRQFELDVLGMLGSPTPYGDRLPLLARSASTIEVEYTGVGYFLSFGSSSLPLARAVLCDPLVIGEVDGIVCGFIAFVENHSLTLECYTYGDAGLPPHCRDRDVVLRIGSAVSS
ncbi:hypothetical protein [Massilia genomosp. 1]|uniref:Uncharacterized protein n=1 Tax=Massilia genomosp. 1 TaxID=2609280 RepID=A0ABX0MME4_9BURK|nr:hypothetical protein [Massilia genomosp. 1]NHZ61626.1 hypothetical protein [Massilia genomosp. 1]